MKGFPDLPPIWAAAIALLSILIGRIFPILSFAPPKWLACVMLCLGFGLVLWSAYFFWKKKTSIEPHHTPTTLIVEGPYQLSRNPIYLGMFLGLLGVGFWTGALSAVLMTVLFPFIINARFIASEEQALKDQFGADAESYLASTSRWIFGV